MESGLCPASEVSLVVVDEAHRATGNHSYCQVIQRMQAGNGEFRVLALSATPGADIKTVQQVINNLLISHIELRTEASMDISPFTHHKTTKLVVCPLSKEITDIQLQFFEVLSIFTKRLKHTKAIPTHCEDSTLKAFALIEARTRFRASRPPKSPESGMVEGSFAMAIQITQCLALLYQHGILSFYTKINQFIHEKPDSSSKNKKEFLEHPSTLRTMTKISGMISQPTFSSHPKLEKLVGFVLEHFSEFGQEDTRIMIFSQYRDSVDEICNLLEQHKPIVRPVTFIGQSSSKKGKGFTQKDQLAVK